MTKIYMVMKRGDWFFTETMKEAVDMVDPEGGGVYECRLIAPRTKKTVVDAANGHFDEVVRVWPPAI